MKFSIILAIVRREGAMDPSPHWPVRFFAASIPLVLGGELYEPLVVPVGEFLMSVRSSYRSLPYHIGIHVEERGI